MMQRILAKAAFAVLVTVAAAAPSFAQDNNGRMRFANKLDYDVLVQIVDTNPNKSKVYKSARISAGKGHGFQWSCGQKYRAFRVFRGDDSEKQTVLASGTFGFYTISDGGSDCQARVRDGDDKQMTWSGLKVAVDYAEMGDNRGQFTLSPLEETDRHQPHLR